MLLLRTLYLDCGGVCVGSSMIINLKEKSRVKKLACNNLKHTHTHSYVDEYYHFHHLHSISVSKRSEIM